MIVDVIYPMGQAAQLRTLAREGLLVSAFAPGTQPRHGRFLFNARLPAALTAGTVLVLASVRSTALNTLETAVAVVGSDDLRFDVSVVDRG